MIKRPIVADGLPGNKCLFDAAGVKLNADEPGCGFDDAVAAEIVASVNGAPAMNTPRTDAKLKPDLGARIAAFIVSSVNITSDSQRRVLFGFSDEAHSLEACAARMAEALRELSDATLAAARCLNASAQGEGCDIGAWMRARQQMHDARLKANAALSSVADSKEGI